MFKKALLLSSLSFAFAAPVFAASEARADEPAPASSASLETKPADVAQTTGDRPSNFKSVTLTANPLSLAFMRIGVNLEYLPAVHHAIVVNPFYQSISVGESSFKNFGGELGYHYYTGTKGADGFFIGPSLVAMSASETVTTSGVSSNDSIFVYGAALDLGGQHVFDNGFTIGGGAGVAFLAANADAKSSSTTFKTSGLSPRILFTIGYSF